MNANVFFLAQLTFCYSDCMFDLSQMQPSSSLACMSTPPPGGRPPPDLRVDHGGAAGVQPQGKPQRSDVVRFPALPGTGQPGPQLELPAAKLYPLLCWSDQFDHFVIQSCDLEKQVCSP